MDTNWLKYKRQKTRVPWVMKLKAYQQYTGTHELSGRKRQSYCYWSCETRSENKHHCHLLPLALNEYCIYFKGLFFLFIPVLFSYLAHYWHCQYLYSWLFNNHVNILQIFTFFYKIDENCVCIMGSFQFSNFQFIIHVEFLIIVDVMICR